MRPAGGPLRVPGLVSAWSAGAGASRIFLAFSTFGGSLPPQTESVPLCSHRSGWGGRRGGPDRRKSAVHRLAVFAGLAFGPFLLLWGPVCVWLLCAAAIQPAFAIPALVTAAVPLAIMVAVHRLAARARSAFGLGVAVYAGWLPLVLLVCWLFVSAATGLSMAVADGVLSGAELEGYVAAITLDYAARAHVFVLPWLPIAALLLEQLQPSWRSTGADG